MCCHAIGWKTWWFCRMPQITLGILIILGKPMVSVRKGVRANHRLTKGNLLGNPHPPMGLEDDMKFSLDMATCVYFWAPWGSMSDISLNFGGTGCHAQQERSRTFGSPQFCVLDLGLQALEGCQRSGANLRKFILDKAWHWTSNRCSRLRLYSSKPLGCASLNPAAHRNSGPLQGSWVCCVCLKCCRCQASPAASAACEIRRFQWSFLDMPGWCHCVSGKYVKNEEKALDMTWKDRFNMVYVNLQVSDPYLINGSGLKWDCDNQHSTRPST